MTSLHDTSAVRLTAENSFQIHSFTQASPSQEALERAGIAFRDVGGDLYVVAPNGGRVEATRTPGDSYGAGASIFNAAGDCIAEYTFCPGGPTGGLVAMLEVK